MNKFRKFFAIVVVATLFPSLLFAQASPSTPFNTSTSTSTESLIAELQAQIKALQTRINELETELGVKQEPSINALSASTTLPAFDRALSLGSTGDDVRNLQQFLAQDKEVYPEGLITAYYGPLTEKAIKKFQEKHGIVSAGTHDTTGYGRIGPKTRSKLNELLAEGAGLPAEVPQSGTKAGEPGKVPPGLLTAPGIEKKIATTTPTTIPRATTTPSRTATTTPSGTIPAQPIGHTGTTTVPATPAQPATGTPPPPPPSGTTPPPSPTPSPTPPPSSTDTTAPAISSVIAYPYSSWGKITWNTNENADGKVEYGLTTFYGSSVASSTLETYHAIYLPNLSSNTAYHYRVISKDAAGNAATSEDKIFTSATISTSPPPSSTKSAVTMSTPNGGEQWQRGSTHEVRWTHSLQDSNFSWQLIVQGSVSPSPFYYISEKLPITQSSFLWAIPTSLVALPDYLAYKMAVQLWKTCITSPCLDQSDVLLSNNKAYLFDTIPFGWGDDSDGVFTITSSSSTTLASSPPNACGPLLTAVNGNIVSLSWPSVANASFYKLDRQPLGASTWSSLSTNVTTLNYSDSPGPGTFTYRLFSCNAVGCYVGYCPSNATVSSLTASSVSFPAPTLASLLQSLSAVLGGIQKQIQKLGR